MKYVDTKVVFREVPDEIALAINISNCPVKCPGCHSSYLAQDIGQNLDLTSLQALVEANPGITCVSFMGGDSEPELVKEYSLRIKEQYPSLKTCWYSGYTLEHNLPYVQAFNFIKVGPYIDQFGPLDSPSTNQRFYCVSPDGSLTDITSRFQRKIF